ncbi:hypothetical protein BR93DRAFT_924859 [Coniochaeta sp. PMI_546]|nr:hypothetical protein BR93DRAFT_924859 [Coniochaeta sp. PMI_546]
MFSIFSQWLSRKIRIYHSNPQDYHYKAVVHSPDSVNLDSGGHLICSVQCGHYADHPPPCPAQISGCRSTIMSDSAV